MVVQHNMTAANANRMLGITTSAQAKSSEKLSSGYKINRAADDAAGLTISEKMRSQIRGLNKASDNAQDGVSLIQVAEGALSETHSILQRMNELATQAANDTNTTADRTAIQKEVDQLASEISRIRSTTQFNTMNLLDGKYTTKNLQVGSLCGQKITVSIDDMSATALSVDALKMTSFTNAGQAMSQIQNAISMVSTQRSYLGALQNRVFGGFPEGVSFAILIMNCCAWMFDKHTQRRQFGVSREDVKAKKAAAKAAKKEAKEAAANG